MYEGTSRSKNHSGGRVGAPNMTSWSVRGDDDELAALVESICVKEIWGFLQDCNLYVNCYYYYYYG